jgi:hypothetical protein
VLIDKKGLLEKGRDKMKKISKYEYMWVRIIVRREKGESEWKEYYDRREKCWKNIVDEDGMCWVGLDWLKDEERRRMERCGSVSFYGMYRSKRMREKMKLEEFVRDNEVYCREFEVEVKRRYGIVDEKDSWMDVSKEKRERYRGDDGIVRVDKDDWLKYFYERLKKSS